MTDRYLTQRAYDHLVSSIMRLQATIEVDDMTLDQFPEEIERSLVGRLTSALAVEAMRMRAPEIQKGRSCSNPRAWAFNSSLIVLHEKDYLGLIRMLEQLGASDYRFDGGARLGLGADEKAAAQS